jgi:hypothetical protein
LADLVGVQPCLNPPLTNTGPVRLCKYIRRRGVQVEGGYQQE